MRAPRARYLAALGAVTMLGPAPPVAGSAAVAPSPCTELALSPAFATDGTAVCAGVVYEPATGTATAPAVFVTTDKGRSWRKAAAAGIAITQPGDYLRGVAVSPRYATDRMVFVQLARAGVFASTDLGATFTLASPLGLGHVTPYVAAPAALGGFDRPLLLHADAAGNDVSMQVDPVLRAVAPVPGTPGKDRQFALSPRYATDGIAFAAGMARSADGTAQIPTVYACGAGFSCTDIRFAGPARSTFDGLWLLPAPTPSGFAVVVRLLVDVAPQVWRSLDGGRTFRPWASVDALGRPMAKAGYRVAFTVDPGRPSRLYLRTSWVGGRRNPPDEQVFVSEDGGTRWRRVAYGSTVALRPIGTIPDMASVGRLTPASFVVAAGGGRLFMLAGGRGNPDYSGPYCSTDGGKTWARLCR